MKKRVFFLVPYPVGKAPSQRFRFEQYFKALSKEDIDYQVHSFLTDKGWETIYSNKRTLMIWYLYVGVLRRIIHLFFVFKYDYVFIHREAAPIGPPVFEWIVAKIFGKKIIYDFDDAIWLYDNNERRNIGTRLKWKSKVAKICSWSWKIVVGNDFLKDFAVQYNSNIIVVPTVVDTKYYHNPDLHKKVRANEITIGWTGTHSTLQYLNSISPLLSKLQKIPNVRILIIANQKPSFSFNFDFRFWKQDTEIEDLMEVDIGVMPLTKDTWSQGKGGFKIIQYFALRIPALASPVGINKRLIRDGVNGFLCNDIDDWENNLKYLINNRNERTRFGKNGRIFIEANYSVSASTSSFLSLFH